MMMEFNPAVMLSLMIIALVSVGGANFNEIYLDAMDIESGGEIETAFVIQEGNEVRFHTYEDGQPGEVEFRARIKHVKGKDFPVFTFFADMGNGEEEITVDLTDYTSPKARAELKDLVRPETTLTIDDQVEVQVIRRGKTAYIRNEMTPEVVIAVHR